MNVHRRCPRTKWLATVAIAAAMGLLGAPRALCGEPREAYIVGYDVLDVPGRQITLRAKLERRSRVMIRPDVSGQTLEFYLGDEKLGSAPTEDDGIAELLFQPPGAGLYTITIRLADNPKYQARNSSLVLGIYEPDTTFLVSDIDHTIADISAVRFVTTANEDVPALKDSPEVLGRLSKKYAIIYITARDDAFAGKTRDWLAMREFPTGPVFFWSFLRSQMSHRRYKTALIASFKETFPNIAVGVGDKTGDARAYLDNGMRAFVITDDPDDDDLPKGAEPVAGWSDVEQALK